MSVTSLDFVKSKLQGYGLHAIKEELSLRYADQPIVKNLVDVYAVIYENKKSNEGTITFDRIPPSFTGKRLAGGFSTTDNIILVGDEELSTMIHEMTHGVLFNVFGHDSNPYYEHNSAILEAQYEIALRESVINFIDFFDALASHHSTAISTKSTDGLLKYFLNFIDFRKITGGNTYLGMADSSKIHLNPALSLVLDKHSIFKIPLEKQGKNSFVSEIGHQSDFTIQDLGAVIGLIGAYEPHKYHSESIAFLHQLSVCGDFEQYKWLFAPLLHFIEERVYPVLKKLHHSAIDVAGSAFDLPLFDRNDVAIKTKLFKALVAGDLEVIQELSKQGVDINQKFLGVSPLTIAVLKDNTDLMQLLFQNGADISAKDKTGNSPLHHALIKNNSDNKIVKFLIDNKADIKAQTSFSSLSSLQLAIKNNNLEAAELLLKNGAELNFTNNHFCLRTAFELDSQKLIELLISYGAKLYADDLELLHIAIKNNNEGMVDKFLGLGYNVNQKDMYGATALHIAAQYASLNIVKKLFASGAEINARTTDDKKLTPLHNAASSGNIEVVEFLLENNANAATTILNSAVSSGNPKIVKLILEANPDFDLQSSDGHILLALAIKLGHSDIVLMLTAYILGLKKANMRNSC